MTGVRVGHWTAPGATTGCTVVCFPPESTASGEVRGGAPATREFALLDPRRTVQHIDAVVLTGGSAFGLATADGVVEALAEQGRGFETRQGPVPIVVALGLFDLADGVPRPRAEHGRLATAAAAPAPWEAGRIGAGAGATLGKWRGAGHKRRGGLGLSTVQSGDVEVTALVAVNALGDIDDGTTVSAILAGEFVEPAPAAQAFENTTIGVIWSNAALDKVECRMVAESGHDGLARALVPAHLSGDGDALVAVATGQVDASIGTVRLLAATAVEQAIRTSTANIAGDG